MTGACPAQAASPPDRWTCRRPAALRRLGPGLVSWDDALALQLGLHRRRVAGEIPDTLLLVEHPSTYTAGGASSEADFLVPREILAREGHDVRGASRGGQVTWHGPGQVVAYPIFDLSDGRRDVGAYLRRLEDVLVAVAARFGAPARRVPGRTGAWCDGGKLAAVGVRLSRWVTLHGTAFNVAPDLSRFDAIVPCGLRGAGVTSLLRETGAAPSMDDAMRAHADAFAAAFGLDWVDDDVV